MSVLKIRDVCIHVKCQAYTLGLRSVQDHSVLSAAAHYNLGFRFLVSDSKDPSSSNTIIL